MICTSVVQEEVWRRQQEPEEDVPGLSSKSDLLSHILAVCGASYHIKGKINSDCVQSVLTYGTETWAMKAENLQSLERTERMMARWIGGVSLKDRKCSMDLYGIFGIQNVADVVMHSRLRWFAVLYTLTQATFQSVSSSWYLFLLLQIDSLTWKCNYSLRNIISYQKHYLMRESTDRNTAEDLNERVQIWSIFQSLIILTCFLEIVTVRCFFTNFRFRKFWKSWWLVWRMRLLVELRPPQMEFQAGRD